MAHPSVNDIYPPIEIPKRHTPWFAQLMIAFALLVLGVVVYGFWKMVNMPARTLELPTVEQPAHAPANNPPQEKPQRPSVPSPLAPLPTPATP